MTPISTSSDLKKFLTTLPPFPKCVAIDTEFIREKTYWPRVCLIQMAVGDQAVVIDPLADGIDLMPLWDFLKRPDVVKIFHAARQDLEGLLQLMGCLPTPFFDTQVAAMACGMRDSISYEDLVSALLGQSIDKSQRVIDWSQRPLSDAQMQYALYDVIYLIKLYPLMVQQLKEWCREDWIAEEMGVLGALETYIPDVAKAWKKVKGWGYMKGLTPRGFYFLQHVAAWREAQASTLNKPRRHVLRDEMVCDYVASFQKDPSLTDVGGRDAGMRDMLKDVAHLVRETPEGNLPAVPRGGLMNENDNRLCGLLTGLLKESATKAAVAQRLIGTRDDLEVLIRGFRSDQSALKSSLLKGWRYDVFGKAALEILESRLEH